MEFETWWANNFAPEPVVTPPIEVARQAWAAGRLEYRAELCGCAECKAAAIREQG